MKPHCNIYLNVKDAKPTKSEKNMTSGTLTIIEKLGGDMFKNMKIPVENNLEEIVEELDKRGYGQCFTSIQYSRFIICRDFGVFFDSHGDDHDFPITTLAELKEM